MSCIHWIELDNEIGQLYEYCRGERRKCTCAGTKRQCNYPDRYTSDNECDICGKEVDYKLFPMLYHDGDKKLLCRECCDHEELRADYEYERWKEEQAEKEYDPDDPDHERDIKESD